MKPVMFCRNTSGMPRWQHSSMKCAPFSADSVNRMPLLAMIADRHAVRCAKPHDQRRAVARLELVERASRRRCARSPRARRRASACPAGRRRRSPRVVAAALRRLERHRRGLAAIQVGDDAARDRQRVRVVVGAGGRPRPRGACARRRRRAPRPLTTSPVAAFTSGGPPRKIVPWFSHDDRSRRSSPARRRRPRCTSPSPPRSAGCPARTCWPG